MPLSRVLGLPGPPRNCTLLNQTVSTVEVWCVAGPDGGLPQHFILELFNSRSPSAGPVARYNATEQPIFLLANLEPDVTFRVVVVAANDKGRSPPVAVSELTFGDPEKRIGEYLDCRKSHPTCNFTTKPITWCTHFALENTE